MAIFGKKKGPDMTVPGALPQMGGTEDAAAIAPDVLYGRRAAMPTDNSGEQLVMPHEQRKITEKDLAKAMETLQIYKDGKANLEPHRGGRAVVRAAALGGITPPEGPHRAGTGQCVAV